VVKPEPAPMAPGGGGTRPVIRLPSPHCRGGWLIFTRIDPTNRDTSMIVHTRPGWAELRDYLTGQDRDGNPRCVAFVCTMSERIYAQEMWRLLDPKGRLIPPQHLNNRVVSVHANDKKTIKRATGGVPLPRELCVVLDDRTVRGR
jgi:RNA polymerase II C-terminal domain phosphatase-like 1/2